MVQWLDRCNRPLLGITVLCSYSHSASPRLERTSYRTQREGCSRGNLSRYAFDFFFYVLLFLFCFFTYESLAIIPYLTKEITVKLSKMK